MPFGATPGGDGVEFRLWAPSAGRVDLCLRRDDGERHLPLAREGDGWFRLTTAEAAPGSRYQFLIDGGQRVPDPASRHQPEDVHGPSEVIDPLAFTWPDDGWRGRPWHEAVCYELHVGTFSARGDFSAVLEHLDHLTELGITAIELMPVADFAGTRGWGYDGVLPFAPEGRYGRPADLKRLVAAAQGRGLMVLLDVVYNHFGPEGNYLHCYAERFFDAGVHTPWGAAIDFREPAVRDFFIHNALYWLEEFRFDGLRLDAVHAIHDAGRELFLEALATAVREGPGRHRQVHLILENDANQAHLVDPAILPRPYDAQWNDDFHHAAHCLLTGERDGYYRDYIERPLLHLARCLTQGLAYQGEPSGFRGGHPRGEPSAHLPPRAWVNFLQNHDQTGNRACGERLDTLCPAEALEALIAVLLLAPSPPLLFMGEEFAAATPFLFFCDFHGALADAVREGRRREFARFARFRDPAARQRIPDPLAESTFARSRLDWSSRERDAGRRRLALCRHLLKLRRERLFEHFRRQAGGCAEYRLAASRLQANWRFDDGARLHLLANLGARPQAALALPGECLYAHGDPGARLPPWSVRWHLEA